MAITINGISCEELVGNYTEGADLRGLTSRKGFLCNWADRYTVAIGLLGYSSTTGVGGTVSLVAPSRHPQLNNCFCNGVEFEGVGTPSQGSAQLAFPKCKVWAIYGSLNFQWGESNPFMNIDPGTQFVYAEQEIDVGCEVITIPGRFLKFSGTTKLLADSYALRIGLVDLKITLHRVPYLPGQLILANAGAINNATYLGVAAGYLLFNGAQNRGQFGSDGTFTQSITYSFTYRTQPWDYSYNGSANAWQKVVRIDGSDFTTRQSFAGLMPGDYY